MKKQKKQKVMAEPISFRLAYYENAQRIAMAFALANMPVTVKYEASQYTVILYKCWECAPEQELK